MEAAGEDGEFPRGIPVKRKAWSKESPNKRRRKNRERKREARARAAARRPTGNTSSEDEEQPGEIGGIPQFFSAFPLNPCARQNLAARSAGLGPAINPRDLASTIGEVQGNSEENVQEQQSQMQEGAGGAESGGDDEYAGGQNEDNSGSQTRDNYEAGSSDTNTRGSTGDPPSAPDDARESSGSGSGGDRNVPGEESGNPRESPELCQPLLENPTSTEAFALAIAKAKGSSHVSDAAVDKILESAVEHMDVLRDFWVNRGSSRLYTRCLRPTLEPFLPTVYTGLLLEEKKPTGLEYRHLDGLSGIPKEYTEGKGKPRIIREEAYVTLKDIKRHHMGMNAKWGMKVETAKEHFKNAALSIDGVQESNKGKKKFHVVTIRLGQSIYLYKIFNPLTGHPAAQTSLGELLG